MVTRYPSKWREASETSTTSPETAPITLPQVWSSKDVLEKKPFLYHTDFSRIVWCEFLEMWLLQHRYRVKKR